MAWRGYVSQDRFISGVTKLLTVSFAYLVASSSAQPATSKKPAAVATLLALMSSVSTDFEAHTVICVYLAGARLAKAVVHSYDPTREVRQIVVTDDSMRQQSVSTLQAMGVHLLQYDYRDKYPFRGYLLPAGNEFRCHTGPAFLPPAAPMKHFDKAMLLKAVLWKLEEYAYILFHDLDVFFNSPPKPTSPVVQQLVAAAAAVGSTNSGVPGTAIEPITELWYHEDMLSPLNAGVFVIVPSLKAYSVLENTTSLGVRQARLGWGGTGSIDLQLWDAMNNSRCQNQDWFGVIRPLVFWEREICETSHTKVWAFTSVQCEQGFLHYVFNHLRRSGKRVHPDDFGLFYHFAGPNKAWNLYNFPHLPHNSWMPPGLVTHHLRLQGWFWDRLYTQHKDRMFPATADSAESAGSNTTATCKAMFEGRHQQWRALLEQHNITWVDGWDWKLWPDRRLSRLYRRLAWHF